MYLVTFKQKQDNGYRNTDVYESFILDNMPLLYTIVMLRL